MLMAFGNCRCVLVGPDELCKERLFDDKLCMGWVHFTVTPIDSSGTPIDSAGLYVLSAIFHGFLSKHLVNAISHPPTSVVTRFGFSNYFLKTSAGMTESQRKFCVRRCVDLSPQDEETQSWIVPTFYVRIYGENALDCGRCAKELSFYFYQTK